ncbi:MAG TPA: phospho-N-acetylmuramoyl-pentapeptide-transferase, partial [Planctomycetaceae bacterium]|nr:phospho-N-acetylmuramoyl-pentapeptide-transferase [Planctomycetaceae bacterium]
MLLWLFHRIVDVTGVDSLAAMTKITFRAALAAGVAFTLALLLGPRMIAWLRCRFREPNRSDSRRLEELHASKHATPTMGGLFLVAGVLAALVLLADPANPFVQVALLLTVGLAAVGAVDDLIKLRGDSRGLSARAKLLGQLAVAAVAAVWLHGIHSAEAAPDETLALWIPLAEVSLPIGWGFVPLAVLVIVGTSKAVNLTDGL